MAYNNSFNDELENDSNYGDYSSSMWSVYDTAKGKVSVNTAALKTLQGAKMVLVGGLVFTAANTVACIANPVYGLPTTLTYLGGSAAITWGLKKVSNLSSSLKDKIKEQELEYDDRLDIGTSHRR